MGVAVLWSLRSTDKPVWVISLVGVAARIRKVVKLGRDHLYQVGSTRTKQTYPFSEERHAAAGREAI